jgi:hypothetical protein
LKANEDFAMRFQSAAGVLLFGASLFTVTTMVAAQAPMGQRHDMPPVKPAVVSQSLTISVDGKSLTFTPAQLQAMPQRSVVVENSHIHNTEAYTGVGIDDLLAKFGIRMDNGGAQKVYHSYVRAEGTDHYFVIYSASELQPSLHSGDALIALSLNGKPLGEQGAFKLVLEGEKKPARWVRNLASLTLVTVQ